MLWNYKRPEGDVCKISGLAAPYFYKKDISSLLYSHSSVKRVQNIASQVPPLRRGALVVDVGANNGWFTRAVAQCHGHICAHLFEPNSDLFGAIKKNLETVDLEYQLSELALTDQKGRQVFFSPDHNSQHGSLDYENATYTNTPNAIIRELNVSTQTLDNYCRENKINSIDLLKVDIQGSELAFLQGAKQSLKNTSAAIIEISLLDRGVHESLAILHSEFPKHTLLSPVSYGGDVLFYR
jgi:FkbM family methyltransferase